VLGLAFARPAGLARDGAADHLVQLVTTGAATVAAAAAVGAGVVLCLRRFAGAIEPAGAAALGGTLVAGVALVLAADVARRQNRTASLLPPLAARGGLVLALAALAWPPQAAGWPVVAAAVVVAGAAVAAFPRAGSWRGWIEPAPGPRRTQARGAGRRRREPQPGQMRQRFERRELEVGGERVRGRIVVAIPAGAKAGYGHLGFCPAFAATPTVRVSTAYDGVDAVVSAAEVLPWGVRVECRLAEPADESVEIPVDLVAEASA
jgi:hypothetical protein